MAVTNLSMLYRLSLLFLASIGGHLGVFVEGISLTLQVDSHERLSIPAGLNHSFTVHGATPSRYSAFSIQLHSQQTLISLYNGSAQCLDRVECVTRGSSGVSMVQILTDVEESYLFLASAECAWDCADGNVTVLVAVVGIEINYPIPGACAQTSNLENDPQLVPDYSDNVLSLSFQHSDVGFDPVHSSAPPICDNNVTVLSRVEYYVYRTCLPQNDFSAETFFDAIEQMLVPGNVSKLQTLLKYTDPKKLLFDSSRLRGDVYNVIAVDTALQKMSAYVPVVTYGCNLTDGGCLLSVPVPNIIVGSLVGLVGLFLCLLAHRFFHVEVYVFTSLIFSFIFFIVLTAVSGWSHSFILFGSIGFGAVSGLLIYTIWFFLGWYYIFVILFGAAADFIITACILFSPLTVMFPVLQLPYVYCLIMACGVLVFMVVLIAFPRALNIASSSLVGSYSIVFCIGVFERTILTDIVLRVVSNAAIPGFISSPSSCQLETIDIVLSGVWGLLFFIGIITQSLLAVQHQRAYQRKQANRTSITLTGEVRILGEYRSFPKSPFKQLKRRLTYRGEHSQPLLSPHSAGLYGAVQ